jgi:phosphatidylglycerophosphatase A
MTPPLPFRGWQRAVHFFALGFGAGGSPLAPGTFGTLMAIPIYLLLRDLAPVWYAEIVVALFLIGIWFCEITENDIGAHDHPAIVWDEIVGYLIAMFLAPAGWPWIVTGFVLFRLFDVWKPFPIRALERQVQGGFGNMLDDALAGLYAFSTLQLLVYFTPEASVTY